MELHDACGGRALLGETNGGTKGGGGPGKSEQRGAYAGQGNNGRGVRECELLVGLLSVYRGRAFGGVERSGLVVVKVIKEVFVRD